MTAEQLKELFDQPLMLLVIMLIASLGSAAKQLVVARRQGTPISVADYFMRIETVIMLGGNVAAWLSLLYTDTLNVAAALGAGYVANDSADTWTRDGRSAAIGKQGGFARVSMLLAVMLVAITALALSGCPSNPIGAIPIACDRSQDNYAIERCAKGIAETWEVYQKRAEEVVTDPLTPVDVKRPIQRAEALTRPAMVEMLKASAAYARIKNELAAGATEEEKFLIANANLERWVRETLPLLSSMKTALGI